MSHGPQSVVLQNSALGAMHSRPIPSSDGQSNHEASRVVIGVDIGTGSARAGVFNLNGQLLASAAEPIQIWKPHPDFVEQSSEDIWRAVGKTIREALETANVAPRSVIGIGYDATCSLVVLDAEDRPLAVNAEGDDERNIIVWMDHRALAETEAINAGQHPVLKYVGGRLSPEMETPKLRWLKNHLPQTWSSAGKFMDLADYLTYRSTGNDSRSLCTVVCKWTYLGHEGPNGRWDESYFHQIGIDDALSQGKFGAEIRPIGALLGPLTPDAARDLGLTTDCAVGVGIIDAHAGGLGLLGSVLNGNSETVSDPSSGAEGELQRLETALALIGGTSNCHMAVSREPRFLPGVWGPYYGAMIPGMWLTEGGQSAAGSAIDHVISSHVHAANLQAEAHQQAVTIYSLLNAELERLHRESGLASPALLTRRLHVLPYFLGNRSPHADPHALAIIDGLSLDETIHSQALLYYATLQAVAYGTRDIVRAVNAGGYSIETLYVTGGAIKNPLWLQEHADATGLPLVLPREPETVLLGAAILAATAAGAYASVPAAMRAMSGTGGIIRPNPATAAYHEAKFEIFRELYADQQRRREQMNAIEI